MNQTIEAIEERETIQPAEINQRIGFSEIIAESHSPNVHHIAEYIPGRAQYRLKTVMVKEIDFCCDVRYVSFAIVFAFVCVCLR